MFQHVIAEAGARNPDCADPVSRSDVLTVRTKQQDTGSREGEGAGLGTVSRARCHSQHRHVKVNMLCWFSVMSSTRYRPFIHPSGCSSDPSITVCLSRRRRRLLRLFTLRIRVSPLSFHPSYRLCSHYHQLIASSSPTRSCWFSGCHPSTYYHKPNSSHRAIGINTNIDIDIDIDPTVAARRKTKNQQKASFYPRLISPSNQLSDGLIDDCDRPAHNPC